jgi:hypothetical protein
VQRTREEDYRRDEYQRRPYTFRQQRSFNLDDGINRREYRDQPRHEFRRTTSQRRSFTPRYQNLFYGYCFNCTNFGHKAIDCKAYGRSDTYVDPHNIECYKCHNYGHIYRNYRRIINPSMKENINIRYMKVWIKKERQEEKVVGLLRGGVNQ